MAFKLSNANTVLNKLCANIPFTYGYFKKNFTISLSHTENIFKRDNGLDSVHVRPFDVKNCLGKLFQILHISFKCY